MNADRLSRYHYFLIFVLGCLTFGPTLKVGFLWDDHVMIERKPEIQSINWTNIKLAFTSDAFNGLGDSYFRPINTLTNMLDFHIWRLDPFGYHLTNLAFHILNACLLYSILMLVFRHQSLSLLTALFFVVNPIIVEQLLIIAGRAEIISMTGMLAAIRCALQRTRLGYILALLFYFVSCLAKESGIVAPIYVALIGWINSDFKFRSVWYVPYLFVGAAYLALRKMVSGTLVSLDWQALPLFLIRDFPSILVHYFNTLLFPTDLHSHRRMLFHMRWMFLSPILILLTLAWMWLRKSAIVIFCALWFVVGLLPKLPLLVSGSLILDHWGYLSGIGVFLGLAFGILRWKKKAMKNYVLLLPAIIIVFWIVLAHDNIEKRNTDKKIYEHALLYPTSSMVHANLGYIYLSEKNYPRAIQLFRESLQMRDSKFAMDGLAVALWHSGSKQEAEQLHEKAQKLQ